MSALSEHLQEYLRLRRGLGHELADAARLLPRFVAYLDANEIEFVTVKAAVAWSLEPYWHHGAPFAPSPSSRKARITGLSE